MLNRVIQIASFSANIIDFIKFCEGTYIYLYSRGVSIRTVAQLTHTHTFHGEAVITALELIPDLVHSSALQPPPHLLFLTRCASETCLRLLCSLHIFEVSWCERDNQLLPNSWQLWCE